MCSNSDITCNYRFWHSRYIPLCTVFYGKYVRIVLEKPSYQHPAFTCSKSTLETPVQCLKFVKSQQ